MNTHRRSLTPSSNEEGCADGEEEPKESVALQAYTQQKSCEAKLIPKRPNWAYPNFGAK
jgi:hypothetical protein